MATIQELWELNLVKAFGLDSASEQEKKEFLDHTSQLVMQKVVERIEQELPEEKREEFLQVFEQPGVQEEKVAFIKQNVPNFEEILLEEMLAFKEEALKVANNIKREL